MLKQIMLVGCLASSGRKKELLDAVPAAGPRTVRSFLCSRPAYVSVLASLIGSNASPPVVQSDAYAQGRLQDLSVTA